MICRFSENYHGRHALPCRVRLLPIRKIQDR